MKEDIESATTRKVDQGSGEKVSSRQKEDGLGEMVLLVYFTRIIVDGLHGLINNAS